MSSDDIRLLVFFPLRGFLPVHHHSIVVTVGNMSGLSQLSGFPRLP